MISLLKKCINKFYYAFSGLFHGLLHDRSISIQAGLGVVVIVVCCFLPLKLWEWIVIISLILLVIAMEFLNSVIEHIVDFVSPEIRPEAKLMKDYGAAMVLIVSMIAAIVGCYIVGGKFL